jgi:hypothetical protein
VSPAASIWGGEFNYYSTQFNHVIVYRFSSADEGWYVRGAYVDGRIPLPSVPADAGPATSTAPATTMNAATHPD